MHILKQGLYSKAIETCKAAYKLGINTISVSVIKPLPQPQPWSSIDRLVLKVLAEKYLKTLEFDSEVLQSFDYKLRHSVGDIAAGLGRKTAPTGVVVQ
ncbi:hypothetical protein NHJ13734_009080 [Beauveria thailandica]